MAIIRTLVLTGFLCLATITASAQTSDLQEALDAVTLELQQAQTTAEMDEILRTLPELASAHPDSDDANVVAFIGMDRVVREHGPNAILDGLISYANAGNPLDAEDLQDVLTPLLAHAADLAALDQLSIEDLAALDSKVKELNKAFDAAGLRFTVQSLIEDPFAQTPAKPRALQMLGKLTAAADLLADFQRWDELSPAERAAIQDNLKTILGPHAGPAFSGPPGSVFAELYRWQSEMADAMNEGMSIVEDAIRNGRVDQERLDRLNERYRNLERGPFDRNTLRNALASACGAIPGAADLCAALLDPLFVMAERARERSCSQITCDCDYAGGGIVGRLRGVECRLREAQMLSQCLLGEEMQLACLPGASGPNATSWEPQPR